LRNDCCTEHFIKSLQKFKTGIASSVVNIENSSLSTMGTEQLLDLFSTETDTHSNGKSTHQSDKPVQKGSYQSLIDSLSELWDEKQYESEYNLDTFIQSLNAN
jgi:TATA-binding protein-associated factor